MQCTVKFFEMPAPANTGGLHGRKVAVKMSAKDAVAMEKDSGRFAEMMAALMGLPTEQIDQSLPKVDWMALEEGAKEWVPLIDLSKPDGTGRNMVQMLMNESNKEPADKGGGDPTLFQLKMKFSNDANAAQNPYGGAAVPAVQLEGLTGDVGPDSQTDGIDPNIAKAALDMSVIDEMPPTDVQARPSIMIPQRAATPEPIVEHLMQESIGLEKESGLSKADARQMMPDMPEQPNPAKSAPQDVLSRMSTIVSPVTTDEQKIGDTGEIKAHLEKKPAVTPQTVVNQGTKDPGANPDLTKERSDMDQRFNEGHGRRQATSKADPGTIFNASSDPSGGNGPGSTITAPLPTDDGSTFQTHLRSIEPGGAGAAKGEGAAPPDAREMQTDVIRQIVQRMTLRADGQTSQMHIRLKPEFLGKMHMDIMTENQQVTIRMTAENHTVKEIIEQNIHVLKAELQQHGLQVQKIDVFVSQDQNSWKNGQQQTVFQQTHDRGRQQGGQSGDRRSESANVASAVAGDADAGIRTIKGEVDFFA